jgi:hypothetical protein
VGDPAGEAEVGFFTIVKITFLSALAVFFHDSENNLPLRGKQVPGAEINGQIWLFKLNLKSNKIYENSLYFY